MNSFVNSTSLSNSKRNRTPIDPLLPTNKVRKIVKNAQRPEASNESAPQSGVGLFQHSSQSHPKGF